MENLKEQAELSIKRLLADKGCVEQALMLWDLIIEVCCDLKISSACMGDVMQIDITAEGYNKLKEINHRIAIENEVKEGKRRQKLEEIKRRRRSLQ